MKELWVELDPKALKRHGVDSKEVAEAVEALVLDTMGDMIADSLLEIIGDGLVPKDFPGAAAYERLSPGVKALLREGVQIEWRKVADGKVVESKRVTVRLPPGDGIRK